MHHVGEGWVFKIHILSVLKNSDLELSGVRDLRTVRRLHDIKKDIFLDILFLMKTKNLDSLVLEKMKQLQYENKHLIPPIGHGAGGLALIWKQEIIFKF